jgi:hypothetical protein
MGVGAFFGKMFGTDQAITTTVNAVRDGLDALVYTPEEKAVDAAKDRAAAREMVVGWMQATSGQNIARRWLSLMITGVWLAQYVVAQVMAISGIFMEDSKRVLKAADIMAGYAEQMNGAVMLILAFYFAAPHMDKIVGVAMERFGKKSPKVEAGE